MKSNTFIILLVVCALLGGIAYFMTQSQPSSKVQSRMGEKVIRNLSLADIKKVTITGPENAVILKESADKWVVENRYNYPADFSKITEIVEKLAEMKIGRSFKASEDTLKRLSLYPPDDGQIGAEEKGDRIVLSGKDNHPLAGVIIGKARESETGSGGHYVKPIDEETIYLIDKDFKFTETEPEKWLEKQVLDVKAADVEKVVCFDMKENKVVYTLERPEKGKDPELVDMPEDKKLKKYKTNSLIGALSGFRIEDIADPELSPDEIGVDEKRLEFHLFDGMVYYLYPGKAIPDDDERFYMKAEVAYIAPELPDLPDSDETADSAEPAEKPQIVDDDQTAETASSAESEKTPEEDPAALRQKQKEEQEKLEKEANVLNEKLTPWVYVISKWKRDSLVTDIDALFEEEKKETDSPS